jgi:hypothetical protein
MRDLLRVLRSVDLSEETVMAMSVKEARARWRAHRESMGLVGAPRLTTEPNGSAKAEHGLDAAVRAAVWMVYLLPADSSGVYQTCRYASPGCRAACLAESGQQGMETRAGRKESGHIFRGRLARLTFLGADPVAFLRLLVAEVDGMARSKWAVKGFALGFRMNGTSDIPFETLVPWLFERALGLGIQPYDYTAWPTSRRDRGSSLVYLVDSVKETHSDAAIRRMARPVVVFDVTRQGALPEVWRGRRVVDADRSDARWLDEEGTVRGLRYKHVSSCSKADALASGFVKVPA